MGRGAPTAEAPALPAPGVAPLREAPLRHSSGARLLGLRRTGLRSQGGFPDSEHLATSRAEVRWAVAAHVLLLPSAQLSFALSARQRVISPVAPFQ